MAKSSVTVLIPIYNQAYYLNRALISLYNQRYKDWELIIINDGSTDHTAHLVKNYLASDKRIRYLSNETNHGLGYTLNLGITHANADYIAYLPADDIYHAVHLQLLFDKLENDPNTILAYSGLKYDYRDASGESSGKTTLDHVPNFSLQLVQVMHRKSAVKWLERSELVTDDLEKMYWEKLRSLGRFRPTDRVTAEWVTHPQQRHRMINEHHGGGIYKYKQYYGVNKPIRFQSAAGNFIDEIEENKAIGRVKVNAKQKIDPLKILLVGELAYNPQRILAFEERGHQLYGLWMENPYFYNTIGPLPFGSVVDIPKDSWKEKIKEIKPDMIYALLNHPAVPLAHEVLVNNPDIPFIWHFKESPFYCRQLGMWDKLIELYEKADGCIYINDETKEWFEMGISEKNPLTFVLDGDLPASYYFKECHPDRLSEKDGEVHTVITGRPFGLKPEDVSALAKQKIHLHLYGDYTHKTYAAWIQMAQFLASGYLHMHPSCLPDDWSAELSKYDAGWLHVFHSENFGELVKVDWLDLNYPARMSTYAAAGLPMIQRNNAMHTVATQQLTKKMDIGIFYETYPELKSKLEDKKYLKAIRENVGRHRMHFSFDQHVDGLIEFFRKVIANKKV